MGISIIDNFSVNATKPIDARYGPYDSVATALSSLDQATQRFRGLVVLLTGSAYLTGSAPTEYWFQNGVTDSDLVVKPGGSGGGTPINATGSGLNNAGGDINTITVKDFTDDVTVTFDAGNLTFLFGVPQAPSPTLNISGFVTDRFNKVTDNYTVAGNLGLNGYTLVSASLFETTPGSEGVRATTDTLSSLSISPTTTGSRSYRLEVTSSNPADDQLDFKVATANETLDKSNPTSPTMAFTPDVQLGTTNTFGGNNEIELGATGSIAFTETLGNANGWVFATGTLIPNVTSAQTVVYNDGNSLLISCSADYSSSGVDGSDNFPALNPSNFAAARPVSSTTTFEKVISLRYGVTVGPPADPNNPKSSFTLNELLDIEAWDTSLGGNIGTIERGRNTSVEINNFTLQMQWAGLAYQWIIIPDNVTLSDIHSGAFTGLLASAFGGGPITTIASPITGRSYKVYRSSAKQVMQAGDPAQSYTLKT